MRIRSAVWVVMGALAAGAGAQTAATGAQDKGETIVMVRHGEKTATELGQLNCRGLNRSLALPAVLIGRFGRPEAIYAPDPSAEITNRDTKAAYSYVRPLATIEPTAVALGMPVNTQIGYKDLDGLEKELLKPELAHATVFVAWEHLKANAFAVQMMKEFGGAGVTVPEWVNSDYETVYVFHVTRGKDETPHVTLEIEKEGLDGKLKDSCPAE